MSTARYSNKSLTPTQGFDKNSARYDNNLDAINQAVVCVSNVEWQLKDWVEYNLQWNLSSETQGQIVGARGS